MELEVSTSEKFSGITIDSELNYKDHFTNTTKKAMACSYAMQEGSRPQCPVDLLPKRAYMDLQNIH